MNMRWLALSGMWMAALVCGGCSLRAGGPTKDTPREVGLADWDSTQDATALRGPAITSAELDELTRAFADRYVGLLSSARDALTKDNLDPVQRREAQELLVNGATSVYDIASNADAFTRVLDLIVVTTLVSQVWIDDDRAAGVFGDRADVLVRALHHGRVEAWALAAQVLRPDQLDLLDYLLWDWRRHNPDMVSVYFVRFSNFAIGRGKSANAEVLAASGFFRNIGQAGQAVGEARLLTERMFYQLKRMPGLLRWQAQALQDGALATPEFSRAFTDMHRLADQVEQRPKHVAAERQALLAALDERMNQADATVANVKATLGEANHLLTALKPAGEALKGTFEAADVLLARYASLAERRRAAEARPFDIREYTEAMKELAVTGSEVNEVLQSSKELFESAEWNHRVQQVNESVDERVRKAAEQSQEVIGSFFWRVYVALGILFVMLTLWLATAFVLMRRLVMRVTGHTTGPRTEGDPAANRNAGSGGGAG